MAASLGFESVAVPRRLLALLVLFGLASGFRTACLIASGQPRSNFYLIEHVAVISGKLFGDDSPDGGPKVAVVEPTETVKTHGSDLLSQLKAGGLILYVRHFHTDHRKWEVDPLGPRHLSLGVEDFLSCEQQRRLAPYGRHMAERFGVALRDLGVPVGKIYSSPYCRCTEGVRLAFRREPDELQKKLIYRKGGFTRDMMTRHLLPMLAEPPARGTNTVIMAHRPQMDDLGRIPEGGVYLFRPRPGGGYDHVGRVEPEEWELARKDPELLGARWR